MLARFIFVVRVIPSSTRHKIVVCPLLWGPLPGTPVLTLGRGAVKYACVQDLTSRPVNPDHDLITNGGYRGAHVPIRTLLGAP
jgi:hypothetical protein